MDRRPDLQLHERVLAAGSAAVLSSCLVNPLDVVKTRMQYQATSKSRTPDDYFSRTALETRRWALANGTYTWPTRNPQEAPLFIHRPPTAQYKSTLDGLLQIVRNEGVGVLYRGMDINLLVGVPLICIYLPTYDWLSSAFVSQGAGSLSPLLAGATARAASVLATSPFELFKTRLQNAQSAANGEASYMSVWRSLALHKQAGLLGRIRTLWTGVGASLAKDVPFAGLYWSLLEPFKSQLQHRYEPYLSSLAKDHPEGRLVLTNATAGAAAGGLAAAVTIPFDVIKTQSQTHKAGAPRMGVFRAMAETAQKKGVRVLFAGVAPRTIRTAVAYAILMSGYELCKLSFAQSPAALGAVPLGPSALEELRG